MKSEQKIHEELLELIGQRCLILRENYIPNAKWVISQRKFASVLGITHPAISNIERGKKAMTMTELLAYSKECKVSYDFLLGRAECKEADNEEINKRTGLSEDAIKNIKHITSTKYYPHETITEEDKRRKNVLNAILESNSLYKVVEETDYLSQGHIVFREHFPNEEEYLKDINAVRTEKNLLDYQIWQLQEKIKELILNTFGKLYLLNEKNKKDGDNDGN